jgi:hypothetical protein
MMSRKEGGIMLSLLWQFLFDERGQYYGYISVGTILTVVLVVLLLLLLL